MALKPTQRMPLVHLSPSSSSSSLPSSSPYTHTWAGVLRHIPAAAQAMRRARDSRPPPPRTVYLLDWDDTCCATTYLERCNVMADLDIRLEECEPQLDRYLRLLEQRVLQVLRAAVRLGTVLIVTNAGDGWVELSSNRFLPAVGAFLTRHHRDVKIVSARARYVDAFRTNPLQWKALTFSDELQTILAADPCKPHDLHVVVLGDSVGDQFAAHYSANSLAAGGMPVVLKVVKFLERPSIDQLCKELAVLLDHLHVMTMHRGPFDVSMYKEPTVVQPQHQYAAHHHHHQQQQQHHQQPQQLPSHHHHLHHHHHAVVQKALPPVHVVDQKKQSSPLQSPTRSAASLKSDSQHSVPVPVAVAVASPVPSVAACAAVV